MDERTRREFGRHLADLIDAYTFGGKSPQAYGP